MQQLVTFYSEGLKLFGNLHLPSPGAPCVVMSHGLDSDKDGDDFPTLAELLGREGIASLRLTHRGYGRGREASEGSRQDTTLTGRIADLRAALDFVESCEVDMARIGAVGVSFGGMVVLGAEDPRIRVLALVAAPCQSPARSRGGSRSRSRLWEDVAQYDLLANINRYRRPVLIVHGSRDEVVPVTHAYRLYEAAVEPKRLEIIESSNHTFDDPRHRQRVNALCVEWFKRHLSTSQIS